MYETQHFSISRYKTPRLPFMLDASYVFSLITLNLVKPKNDFTTRFRCT